MRRTVNGFVQLCALMALVLAMTMATACDKGDTAEGEEGEATAEGGEATAEGGEATAEGGEATAEGGEGQEAEPEELTPEQIGERIGQKYIEAMLELKAIVESQPDVETLLPQIEAMHERYVQELVALGRLRWALDETQRMQADSAIRRIMFRDADAQIGGLGWMNAALEHYRPLNNDLANLISSFNIITQYADFMLLVQQSPEEAQRLGLPPQAE